MGLGANFGVATNINEYWKMKLSVKAISFGLGEQHDSYQAVAATNVQLSADSSLSFSYTNEQYADTSSDEVMVSFNYYF